MKDVQPKPNKEDMKNEESQEDVEIKKRSQHITIILTSIIIFSGITLSLSGQGCVTLLRK